MKTVKNPSLVLLAALAALSSNVALAQRTIPVNENMDSFNPGNVSSDLPADFYVEAADAITWRGLGNGTTTGSGFWSLGNNSSATDRAFGILETSGFGDARLALAIKANSTTAPITQLRVRYNVEEWRDGERVSAIKLKYSPDAVVGGVIPGGFSELPELVVTNSPVTNNNNTALDGNVAGKVAVDYTIILPQPLNANDEGTLRWQHSSTGSGSRDKIGVDDIIVEDATPVGIDFDWTGGDDDWTAAGAWNGSNWNNGGNSTAVFGGSPATVTVDTAITAVNLKFTVDGYLIGTSGPAVTVKGIVNVDDSTGTDAVATVDAPIAGTVGLVKTGPDTLVVTSGSHSYTGTTSVAQGTLAFDSGASAALPSASSLFVSDNATFDLGGGNRTRVINGVSGGSLGTIEITDNTLEINTAGTYSYKGNITGAGNVVKKGVGSQKFRNQQKGYSGTTRVENGILEVTENSRLNSTSSVTVDGSASELRLSTDTPNYTFVFGANAATTITLSNNGSLASETDQILNVDNNLVIDSTGGYVYARGTAAGAKVTLNGSLTGSGKLSRQGQAELVVNGTASSFTGNVDLNNGLTTLPTGKTLGAGSITVKVQGANSLEPARIRGNGTVGGSLTFAGNSSVTKINLSELSGVTKVSGNLDLGSTTIVTTGFGSGTYDLFDVTGSKSYGSVTITGGGSLSTVGNIVRLTK